MRDDDGLSEGSVCVSLYNGLLRTAERCLSFGGYFHSKLQLWWCLSLASVRLSVVQ